MILLVVQWNLAEFQPLLYLWALFMAVSVAVIAHNHNHLQIWTSQTLNSLTDYWLTIFYGFPVFGWIPTHNMNHHKFNNRDGDYTLTFRYTERNNLLTLLSYPSISGYHQQRSIHDYLKRLWSSQRRTFWFCISQYIVLVAFIGFGLWLDWKKALLFIVIPQQVSLFSVLIFNYLQHVHADEESEFNHSRNIVGPWLNRLLFNNGLHTVHHHIPGLHWSKLREPHDRIANRIDPALQEQSFWWLIVRTYILGLFIPRFRSTSMRVERMKRSLGGELVTSNA
jgi:fatty acid desaturase